MKARERAERQQFLLSHFVSAPLLYRPEASSFAVITARKDNLFVRRETEQWLEKHFPGRVTGLYMLDRARCIENVVEFKSSVLKELSITDYAEDSRTVLRGIKKSYHIGNLWWFNGGELISYA